MNKLILVFVSCLLLPICSCTTTDEYYTPLTIENLTNETVSIYVHATESESEPIYIGKVRAKKKVVFRDSHIMTAYFHEYLIEAKTNTTIIFSKVFTLEDFKETDWKITLK